MLLNFEHEGFRKKKFLKVHSEESDVIYRKL